MELSLDKKRRCAGYWGTPGCILGSILGMCGVCEDIGVFAKVLRICWDIFGECWGYLGMLGNIWGMLRDIKIWGVLMQDYFY